MQDSPLPASFIGLLANHLAKLQKQLRHLLAGDPGPAAAPDRAWSVRNRLRAAAVVLNAASDPEFGAALGPLAGPCEALVASLDVEPGVLPAHLLGPLDHLATQLEAAFAQLDAGTPARTVAADPAWETLLSGFLNAGTVLQPLDEIEERLAAWSHRYGDAELSPSQEEALRERWSLLRAYGDSLFGVEGAEAGAAPGHPAVGGESSVAGRRLVLLLDSPFRRSQLGERLAAAGCVVANVTGPDEAARLAGGAATPDAILCDNLEPSRHLQAVRSRLAQLAEPDRPILVLVAATGDEPSRLRERARLLGAAGAWSDPWRIAELAVLMP